MKKTLILFLLTLLFVPFQLYGQSIRITGSVVDEATGEPMIGVSVVVVGTTKGIITDINGNFALDVSIGANLKFSYIGYDDETITVNSSTPLRILMRDVSQEIEEVVVVGAIIKKSDLTGAAVRVTSEKLKELPTANINQALQGKIPGVYIETNPKPGANAGIKVRGSNSIHFGQSPIYVVDNVMMDNGIDMLNPDDIASIDVLKDASATALYGAKGANGVIVITTKKGQRVKGQKEKVSTGNVFYDFWYGSSTFSNEMPLMSANDLYDFRVDAYANAYMDKNPTRDREKYVKDFLTHTNPVRNRAFSKEELESYAEGLSYNWLNEIVRTGLEQNHSLGFSGGGQNSSYYVSFGYNDQVGQLLNSGYERYTGKMNLEHDVKPWLKIGSNNSFIYSKENPVATDNTFIVALRASPLLPISEEYWYMREGKIDNQSANNPLRDLNVVKDRYKIRFFNSSFVSVNPIKDLDIRSTFSVDALLEEDYTYNSTETTQSYKISADGQAIQTKSKNLNWQWDNTASYNTIFADVHRFSAMVGFNMSMYNNAWNSINAVGFGNDWFDYKKMDGATKKEDFYISSDFSTVSQMSYFGRLNYVYDSRYYLTATLRRDGASKFGSFNKWGTFPSVAFSWNITGESFMQDQSFINNLRLRTGYGHAGNQNIPSYRYLTLFNPRSSLGSTILFNDGILGNPTLRWETQKQFNAGLDLSVWHDRVNLVADYFFINNDGLLMGRSLAPSYGFTGEVDNVGAMENKGVELSLDVAVVRTTDFQWNLGMTLSADKNKVTKLFDNAKEIYNLGGYSNNEIQREGNLFVGYSINNIYVYEFDRIVQESDMEYVNTLNVGSHIVKPGDPLPKDRVKDGIINDKDRYIMGRKDPDFYGGVTTNLSYKGLALNVITTYSVGAKRTSYLYETLMGGYGTSAAHIDMMNRWTPENTDTNIPRAYSDGGRYGLGEMDWAIQDASFFRISNVTLSYSLPKKWINTIYMSNLRLYTTLNNPLVFTNYKGFDPESGDWYPSSKTVVFGLNLAF